MVKSLISILLIISASSSIYGQEVNDVKKERMPLFNGAATDEESQSKIYNYFSKKAKQEKIKTEGTVMISFVVDTSGIAIDPVIRASNNEELNELAIKYVLEMPRWTPGMQDHKPVKTQFTVPIRFSSP